MPKLSGFNPRFTLQNAKTGDPVGTLETIQGFMTVLTYDVSRLTGDMLRTYLVDGRLG